MQRDVDAPLVNVRRLLLVADVDALSLHHGEQTATFLFFSPSTPNVVTCVCTVTAIGSRFESRGKPEVVAAVLSMSFRKPRYLVFIAQSVHLVYPLSRLFKS